MLITFPDPRFAIRGSRAAVREKGPLRLVAMTASKVASSTCAVGPSGYMPATRPLTHLEPAARAQARATGSIDNGCMGEG